LSSQFEELPLVNEKTSRASLKMREWFLIFVTERRVEYVPAVEAELKFEGLGRGLEGELLVESSKCASFIHFVASHVSGVY
jgi:hypothetical protein